MCQVAELLSGPQPNLCGSPGRNMGWSRLEQRTGAAVGAVQAADGEPSSRNHFYSCPLGQLWPPPGTLCTGTTRPSQGHSDRPRQVLYLQIHSFDRRYSKTCTPWLFAWLNVNHSIVLTFTVGGTLNPLAWDAPTMHFHSNLRSPMTQLVTLYCDGVFMHMCPLLDYKARETGPGCLVLYLQSLGVI